MSPVGHASVIGSVAGFVIGLNAVIEEEDNQEDHIRYNGSNNASKSKCEHPRAVAGIRVCCSQFVEVHLLNPHGIFNAL